MQCIQKKMCFEVTRWHFQFRFTVLLPRCCNTLSFLVIWASKAMIYNRYNELITHLVAVLLRNLLLTHHHHIPVTWPRKSRRTATPQWDQTLFEFAFSCNFTSYFGRSKRKGNLRPSDWAQFLFFELDSSNFGYLLFLFFAQPLRPKVFSILFLEKWSLFGGMNTEIRYVSR